MSFIRLSRIKFLQRTLQSVDSRVQSAAHFLQAADGIIDLRRRFREVVAPLVCRDGYGVLPQTVTRRRSSFPLMPSTRSNSRLLITFLRPLNPFSRYRATISFVILALPFR